MIFRWSVWGEKQVVSELLPWSIGSFRRAFGSSARYVVGTDEPSEVRALIGDDVEVLAFDAGDDFNIAGRPTWRKWCPRPRLDATKTEFYVDSDLFLVGEPNELRQFGHHTSKHRLLVMQEADSNKHRVGSFGSRVLQGIPAVNTGLVGQRAGTDITAELLSELKWWKTHVPESRQQFHDDQGAVVAILSRYFILGQVLVLPEDRYRIVSPTSNRDLTTLNGLVAIHTTYGQHPGFYRFRSQIETRIENLSPPAEAVGPESRSDA